MGDHRERACVWCGSLLHHEDDCQGKADYQTIRLRYDCWAIRQISTGKYLPMRWKRARGYSFDEPSFAFPRLFPSQRSASSALAAWLQGEWKMDSLRSGEYGEEIERFWAPEPVEGRMREDFEIVQFELVETWPNPWTVSGG